MNGWVQMHRSIMEHWIWQDMRHGYRWMELTMLATWKPIEVFYRSNFIELKRGQLLTSFRALARRWKTNHRVVSSFIKMLEKAGMVECDRSNKHWIIITITNYDKYQNEAAKDQKTEDFEPNSIGILSDSAYGLSDKKKVKNDQKKNQSGNHELKNNNINNNKQNSSFSSSVREINLKFCSDFKSNGKEMEDLAKLLKCNLELVGSMMDDFIIEAVDEEHENAAKFRKHFIGWARIYLKKNGKDGQKQSKQEANPASQGKTVDRLSPRRGFDPGIHEAKDFEGKF